MYTTFEGVVLLIRLSVTLNTIPLVFIPSQTMASLLRTTRLLIMLILCCERGQPCDFDLVTGPHGVSDNAITASSTYGGVSTNLARINSVHAWCPHTNGGSHYLQVEFRTVSLLKAIKTKGRASYSQWVRSYKASSSMDGLSWTYILNSTGDIQVFPGNKDRTTQVKNELARTVRAKYIRVTSVSVYDLGCMRLEVVGCPVPCDTWHSWKAKLGSSGDSLQVLLDSVTSNQGKCGVKCSKQTDCDSFLFDVTSARCFLLTESHSVSNVTVNLNEVWYFVKN